MRDQVRFQTLFLNLVLVAALAASSTSAGLFFGQSEAHSSSSLTLGSSEPRVSVLAGQSGGLVVSRFDVQPKVIPPGGGVTATLVLKNNLDVDVLIEDLTLVRIGELSLDLIGELIAPEVHPSELSARLNIPLDVKAKEELTLRVPFKLAADPTLLVEGRNEIAVSLSVRSAGEQFLILSPSREVLVSRLLIRNLKVFPTVIPDCSGVANINFEFDLFNPTFDTVNDVEISYETRTGGEAIPTASGNLQIKKVSPGESVPVSPPSPLQIPQQLLARGQRALELTIVINPSLPIERRVIFIGSGADLKVEDVTFTPENRQPGDSAMPGDNVALNFTVVNRGNQTGMSDSFVMRFFGEASGKAMKVSPDSITLKNLMVTPCGGAFKTGSNQLPGGVELNVPVPVIAIPEDAEEGDATVRMLLDRISGEENTDSDVQPAEASFHIDLPNLRPTGISVPPEADLGQDLAVGLKVSNVKDHPHDIAPVQPGVNVKIQLIQNGKVLNKTEFQTKRIIEAGQSESSPLSSRVKVPASADRGDAIIKIEVDLPTAKKPRGEIRESDETDNVIEVPLKIVGPLPDLTVQQLNIIAPGDPPTVVIGAPLPILFFILNQGVGRADPATYDIALSLTISIGPLPIQLKASLMKERTGTIAPGRFVAIIRTVQIPPMISVPGLLVPIPVPPGPAEIIVTADSEKTNRESDEDNNTASVRILLVPPISSLSGSCENKSKHRFTDEQMKILRSIS